MALVDDINLFLNKANTKIAAYAAIIEPLLAQGLQVETTVDLAAELIEFTESLNHVNNPWTDDEKIYWMAFMTERHELTDIVYQDYDTYVIPTPIINSNPGDGITWAQLAAALVPYTNKDNQLQDELDTLQSDIVALDIPGMAAAIDQLELDVIDLSDALAALTIIVQADEADLAAHIGDTDVHIQPGERDDWDAKISPAQLTAELAGYSEVGHTHAIADVLLLQGILDDLAAAIAAIDPADGNTPSIQIGTVTEGVAPSVTLGPGSTDEIPIFDFVLKTGEPFTIDEIGLLDARSDFDSEDSGFTYFAVDTGFVYIRVTSEVGTWSNPIQFTGDRGWSPVWGLVEVSASVVVKQLISWIGGTGDVPDLDLIYGEPVGTLWYAGPIGFTSDINEAVNIKGVDGLRFRIDIEAADRSVYDDELKGFTFLSTITGKVSFKLSDDSADWSNDFTWVGAAGIFTVTVPVSAAQIISCGTVPVVIVAAPGANLFHSTITATLSYKAGTVAFTHTESLVLKSVGGDAQYTISGYLNSLTSVDLDLVKQGQIQIPNVAYVLTTIDGSDDIIALGDGDIEITLSYKIINKNI